MKNAIRCWLFIAALLSMSASVTAIGSKPESAGMEWKPITGAAVPAVFHVEFKAGFLSSSKSGDVNVDWSGIKIKAKDVSLSIEPASIQNMYLKRANLGLLEMIHNWLVVDFTVDGKKEELNIRYADDGPGSQPPFEMLYSMYYVWKYSGLPEPERYAFAITSAEAYEASGGTSSLGGYIDGNKKQLAMLDHVERDIDAYLTHQETNSDAWLLKVRLLRNMMVLTPTVISGGKNDQGPSTEFYNRAQEILNGILAVHTTSAEAHYWKARLYGMGEPKIVDGKLKLKPHDLERAIEHAVRAVEINSDNMRYREAAAIYYIDRGKWNEARDIVASLNPKHPIAVVVSDMQSFPLPAGSIFLEEMSRGTAEIVRKHGLGYERIRARSYMVPVSVKSLAKYYKEKWKQFRLFKDKKGRIAYRQFIKLYGGKMKPSLSRSELPKDPSIAGKVLGGMFGLKASKKQGIMMMVIDGADVDAEHRATLKAPATGDFCLLQLINLREF